MEQQFEGVDAKVVKHIFNNIDEDRLYTMLQKKIKCDIPEDATAKDIIQLAVSNVERIGARELFGLLGKIDAETYCEAFGIPLREEGQTTTKNYLAKALSDRVGEKGISAALKGVKDSTIISILEVLDVNSKRDVKGVLEDIIREIGIQIFLGKMSAETLNEVCADLNINYENESVNLLVTAIITGKVPEKKEVPKLSPKKPSKTKPALKRGVTGADIFQHYFKPELQEYCRENDLKISGTTKELIDRILDHLDETTDTKENKNANWQITKKEKEKEKAKAKEEKEKEKEEEKKKEEKENEKEKEKEKEKETTTTKKSSTEKKKTSKVKK